MTVRYAAFNQHLTKAVRVLVRLCTGIQQIEKYL